MRGRRTSIALIKMQGAYRPSQHKHRLSEPEFPGELREMMPPEWMSEDQRRLWVDTLTDCPAFLLRRIDWAVFATYIEVLDRHGKAVIAQRKLDEGQPLPFLVKGSNGPQISPYVREINRCAALMIQLQNQMGFTPFGRTKISLDANKTIEHDDPNKGWGLLGSLRTLGDANKNDD